jgi:hypothetical protein
MHELAKNNLALLEANPYPGRGIVIGRTAGQGAFCQLYWIMGRSANSRNRYFAVEEGRLKTRPIDPAKVENPDLIIYTAMDRHLGQHVVSNGDHTDTVMEALRVGGEYRAALRQRSHEHDAPHYTPRISAGIEVGGSGNHSPGAWMSILKADPDDPDRSIRAFYEYDSLHEGFGWCITTYRGDDDPLPSFSGEPYLLPLAGAGEDLLETFWGILDTDNRVALALKTIDESTGEAILSVKNAREPE